MYNDDPLRQPGPHTRSYTPKRWQKPHTRTHAHTSRVTKVTHTHTYTRRPAEPGGSAYGVGAVGCSRSGVARGQRALLEADDAVGDVHSVGVDRRHADRCEVVSRCLVGAEHTRRVRHEGGVSGEDLPQRAEQGVHKAAAVRALRVAECTRRVRAAHHTVRARAVCIRVTTRAPPQCSQHTQASTACRRAGHAIRPRRAPTRASGAERTATAHVRRLASRPGPADVAPGLAAAAMGARA